MDEFQYRASARVIDGSGRDVTPRDNSSDNPSGNPPGNAFGNPPGNPLDNRRVALVDLLDRLLAGGVVAMGDIELSIADVPLVRISLRAVIASVSSLAQDATRELADGSPQSDRGR
jgi:gas vesicle protein GvpA/GvpJ/GvpM family